MTTKLHTAVLTGLLMTAFNVAHAGITIGLDGQVTRTALMGVPATPPVASVPTAISEKVPASVARVGIHVPYVPAVAPVRLKGLLAVVQASVPDFRFVDKTRKDCMLVSLPIPEAEQKLAQERVRVQATAAVKSSRAKLVENVEAATLATHTALAAERGRPAVKVVAQSAPIYGAEGANLGVQAEGEGPIQFMWEVAAAEERAKGSADSLKGKPAKRQQVAASCDDEWWWNCAASPAPVVAEAAKEKSAAVSVAEANEYRLKRELAGRPSEDVEIAQAIAAVVLVREQTVESCREVPYREQEDWGWRTLVRINGMDKGVHTEQAFQLGDKLDLVLNPVTDEVLHLGRLTEDFTD